MREKQKKNKNTEISTTNNLDIDFFVGNLVQSRFNFFYVGTKIVCTNYSVIWIFYGLKLLNF